MLNRVVLIGRLTRDPVMRYTPQGTAVANFTLAINRKFNKDETDFVNCVIWRKQAENCANYLQKGSLCAVEGRIQVRNYQNQEGKKIYVTEVVADDVRFLDSKGKRQSNPKDDFSDIGREVSLEDIELGGSDEIPF